MKIVILERNSVGLDIDVERIRELGEVDIYPNTVTLEEVAERVKDADIVVSNNKEGDVNFLEFNVFLPGKG